jgi:SAM-dependent methyltransferase
VQAENADVRQLPYQDETFDAIVSNSTLDHFPAQGDLLIALKELHRVLRPGGTLLVTLDNPINPVVAVRNALPARLRAASGLVAFPVGSTHGPRQLRGLLRNCGFDVTRVGASFHAPRVLVVMGGRLVDRHGGQAVKRLYARFWTSFEQLAALPTRFITGHFVAALARKR